MPLGVRHLAVLTVTALVVLGAAGLSGSVVGEDYCLATVEGTSNDSVQRWAPPGLACVTYEASASNAQGSLNSTDQSVTVTHRMGSWPRFLTALAFGLGVLALAVRSSPTVPAWRRLSADTVLVFAISGTGALYLGWSGSVFTGIFFGVPSAVLADRFLWPDRGAAQPWTAILVCAAVMFSAVVMAAIAWLGGLGLAGYGLTVLLVAAVTALPWRGLWPRPAASI